MKRWARNIATILSLLVCVALLALWVDTRALGHVRRLWSRPIYTENGGIHGRVEVTVWKKGVAIMVGMPHVLSPMGMRVEKWTGPGVVVETRSGRGDDGYDVDLSHWLLPVIAGLAAACGAATFRATRPRGARGACAVCGYDLRATPDRCPECGTPVAASGGRPAPV